jgi:hypothetical protein
LKSARGEHEVGKVGAKMNNEKTLQEKPEPKIGPFFWIAGRIIASCIPASQGELRGGKSDNPHSHEEFFYAEIMTRHRKSVLENDVFLNDYIFIPRGRVVWDTENEISVIYLDVCIEQTPGAVNEIASIYGLGEYIALHDGHYVCRNCKGDIWDT